MKGVRITFSGEAVLEVPEDMDEQAIRQNFLKEIRLGWDVLSSDVGVDSIVPLHPRHGHHSPGSRGYSGR